MVSYILKDIARTRFRKGGPFEVAKLHREQNCYTVPHSSSLTPCAERDNEGYADYCLDFAARSLQLTEINENASAN